MESGERLSWGRKVGYGVGDLGSTLFFQLALLYLVFFYTDVAGISPAAVGTILLVARLVDATANPVIGAFADRTRTRWGRFRPFLLLAAVPLALTAIATFTAIPGSLGIKQLYATVTYSAFSLCFAAVAIPYSAMLATISSDPDDRTALGTLRAGFSFTAGILVSYFTLRIVSFAGGGQTGWHVAIGVFGVVGVALIWTTFATTREGASPPRADVPGLKESVNAVRSKPMLLFMGIFLLTNIVMMLRSAGAIYFFKYTIGREDLVANFQTFGAVLTVIAIVLTPFLGHRIGKRNVMFLGQAIMAVGHIGVCLVPPGVTSTFFWLGFLPNFGFGLVAATAWPILADCVDYVEWESGKKVEGVAYGFTIFAQKLALALGGAGVGWTLAASGYIANAHQSASASQGILALVGYFPVLALVIAVVLSWRYPLNDGKMREIAATLSDRNVAG